MDPKEMEGLFRGPAIRTLFGRMTGPRVGTSPKDDMKRIKAAELVNYIVSRHYIILERRHDESGIFLKVRVDTDTNEEMFDEVRNKLKRYGLYPRLIKDGGSHFILVFPLPKRKKGGTRVNLILLIATLFTTIWAGSLLWMMRGEELDSAVDLFAVLIDVETLFMGGLTFALPLLLILGTHEFGHYFTARRYRIDASLPYFIPIPPFISPIGTFGALISMKEPISNKKSLVDIGAAGPIAGFIVAIPVTIIGLLLTKAYPVTASLMEGETVMIINPPLLFQGFMMLLGVADEGVLFPTAFAGWLGLFVTALNLLPVGQLDGGHIMRGILGDRSKYVSMGAMVMMVVLGIITGFTTYIFFAILILFLGARHPPPLDDISPLSKRQWVIAGISLLIMTLTFHPVPLEQMTIRGEGVDIVHDWDEHFVSPLVPNYETILLENDGRSDKEITLQVFMEGILIIPSITNKTLDVDEQGWGDTAQDAFFTYKHDGWYILLMGPKRFDIDGESTYSVPLILGCSLDKEFGNSTNITMKFETDEGKETINSFNLIRANTFLEMELGDYHGSKVINGTIWNLNGISGNTSLTITRENATGTGVFIFHPGNGSWSNSNSSPVVTEAGIEKYFISLNWGPADERPKNATFTLELEKHTERWEGEDIVVSFEGPMNLTGSRAITHH